jgi:7-carboxy-7-deazaguanine synthase
VAARTTNLEEGSISIKVSEIFMSLQGEGKFVGVPSLFVRTFGCNFTCSGFGMPRGEKSTERFQIDPTRFAQYKDLPLVKTGCDSYPSWDPMFKQFSPLMEIEDIVDEMTQLLPNGRFGKDKHLILTGGEPLLGWQKQYPALLEEIYGRELGLTDLTFETNGTQKISPELRRGLCDSFNYHKLRTTFSVSAKLPVSGEKWEDAIKPEVIMDYTTIPGNSVYLKFVVATEQDVDDVKKAVEEYRNAGFLGSVYLMPVGGTDEGYYLNNKTVAELALKNGYRYSPRLQCELYKNSWGT